MSDFKLNPAQEQAATTLRGPVSIAAGAGSGKTRVLAERAANAVVPGRLPDWDAIPLERLLAITFTDKAAGELAERVRRTLRDAGHRELAADVDAAWISTIHGMCSRILRASALEAGIDPSFSVLDTVEMARMRQEAFDAAAAELLERDGAAGIFSEYSFDRVAQAVMGLASALRTHGLGACDIAYERGRAAHELCQEALIYFREAEMRAGSCTTAEPAVKAQHAEACGSTAARLEALSRLDLPVEELLSKLVEALGCHAAPRSHKGILELKNEVADRRIELLKACIVSAAENYAVQLIELTDRYLRNLDRAKEEAGALDFDDLQGRVAALLEQDEAVSSRWSGSFDVAMVDEFQDTDHQQLRIVRMLAGENLCTVGDALQSIYRFRGADIDVYRGHNRRMDEAGAVSVALSQNYRSHPDILGFVNGVFGEVVGDELVRLTAGRTEPDEPVIPGPARVEVYAATDGKADECRAAIAERIARRVSELHHETKVPLSDIVVLVRAYTHAGVYADALSAVGLDTVVVGGNRFLEQPEVCVLEALCRLLGNAADEEALGSVLLSPLCDLTDDGLLALRRHAAASGCGLWDALGAAPLSEADDLRRRVLLDVVGEARGLLGARPLGEVILRMFERSGWDVACLARGSDGLHAYATVLKFARMADGFDGGKGQGPAAFAAYLEAKRRFGDHEAPAAVVGESAQAVRIMSIHASKGLEFPVVIIPELDGKTRADDTIARWSMDPAPRIALRLSSSRGKERSTPWFDELDEAGKKAEYDEYLRVFYVGFTRARELLILAGQEIKPDKPWMMAAVQRVLEHTPALHEDAGPVAFERLASAPVPECPDTEPVVASTDAEVVEWLRAVHPPARPVRSAVPPPARLSYSGVSSYGTCGRRFKATALLGMPPARTGRAHGVSAVQFGSAVHAALQARISADDEASVRRLARLNGLDEDATARLIRVLAAYHASDIAELERSWEPDLKHEAPFAIRIGSPDEGFVLDGSIDAYAKRGSEALVIDYKTGTTGDTAELEERYRLQARCYALAALRDGARSVHVVFVRPEVTEPDGRLQRVEYRVSVDDAGGIEADLLAVHAAMVAGCYEPRERRDEFACAGCPVDYDCPAPW